MDLQSVFKDWGSELNSLERAALEEKAQGRSVNSWKSDHIAMAVGSGALTGAMGGPVGVAAILPDLLWCKKVGIQGCLGIGHILGCDVDYDEDMNQIISGWTGMTEVATSVPAGKVGIKISNKVSIKVASKVAGRVVEKAVLKSGSKLAAKLAAKAATKAAAKLGAKLAVKAGVGWIPLVGGIASGGINWWLVGSLLDEAEKYYKGDFLVLNDPDLVANI